MDVESKISVIIPTLWVPKYVFTTLIALNNHELVGQIIIIDNSGSPQYDLSFLEKVTYIAENKNTFVNPAWNKAVGLAVYNKLLFLNDDVYTNWHLLDLIFPHISPETGMIGLGDFYESNYPSHEPPLNELVNSFRLDSCSQRPFGYACLFFLHKNVFHPIPSELKVFFGDDFLFKKSNKPNLQIKHWPIYGEISKTIDALDIQHFLRKEQISWNCLKKN